jgi:hypothetical protein
MMISVGSRMGGEIACVFSGGRGEEITYYTQNMKRH